jgi:hypothetical protein
MTRSVLHRPVELARLNASWRNSIKSGSLVFGIRGKDGRLGRETADVHFQHRLHDVGDLFGAQLRGIFLLREAGGLRGNFGVSAAFGFVRVALLLVS